MTLYIYSSQTNIHKDIVMSKRCQSLLIKLLKSARNNNKKTHINYIIANYLK